VRTDGAVSPGYNTRQNSLRQAKQTIPARPFFDSYEAKNVHRRFSRWAETSVWERVFHYLADDADINTR
jgi:hypothetical protein